MERAGGHGGTVYDDYFISGSLVPRQGLDHGGPMVMEAAHFHENL